MAFRGETEQGRVSKRMDVDGYMDTGGWMDGKLAVGSLKHQV